jgi:hypothetical protein
MANSRCVSYRHCWTKQLLLCGGYDTQMTHRNFWLLRVLGSTLRLKAEANSSSRGQKDFICRDEMRKAAWGHAVKPRNQWSHGSDWKLGFIVFIYLFIFWYYLRVEVSLSCKLSWEGEMSPWPIITFWELLQSFPSPQCSDMGEVLDSLGLSSLLCSVRPGL